MVVATFPRAANDSEAHFRVTDQDSTNWVRIAAGGTLLAGGLLMLTGRHRAGMVVAASGTALALLDQQEVVTSWWKMLPVYIDDVQRLLTHVQVTVEDISAKRDRLREILGR